jgi:hypothetical protein
MTALVVIVDLYKRSEDLKRDLAAVEIAIDRCQRDWTYTPGAAVETATTDGPRHVPDLKEMRNGQ